MKKALLILFALLAPLPAQASVSCSLPFNLQNGVTADATQVMANYNALLACFGNAAKSGVNNDITSLTALTSPITPTQGGTAVFTGGTTTGAGNAQVLTITNPNGFALTTGYQATFTAGFSNSDATTLNINATGATNVYRKTQLGIKPLVGGEIVAGEMYTVIYDGTQYQLQGERAQVGQMSDWSGTTSPAGWAFQDGSCQLRVGIYAALFAVIGTGYDPTGSTCDSANFAMPDSRGRMNSGRDNMGGTAANRITAGGGNCNGGLLGVGCGQQNRTIGQGNLPNVALSTTITDPGHVHTVQFTVAGGNITAGGVTYMTTIGGPSSSPTVGNTTGVTATTSLGGSGTALVTLGPLQVVNKIIKY